MAEPGTGAAEQVESPAQQELPVGGNRAPLDPAVVEGASSDGPGAVGSPTSGQEAPTTHFKTLEAADAAARKAWGETDRLKQELKQWEWIRQIDPSATPESVRQFVEGMYPVTQRPDFQSYVTGKLGTSNGAESSSEEEDEYLSPEERKTRELEREVREIRGQLNEQAQRTTRTSVDARFAEAERRLVEFWGEDLWSLQRDNTLRRVQELVSQGLITNPDVVDTRFLQSCFLSGFRDDEEQKAFILKAAQRFRDEEVQGSSAMGTTVPNPSNRAAETRPPAKTIRQAYEYGLQDLQAGRGSQE